MKTSIMSWREWAVLLAAVDGIDLVRVLDNDYYEEELKACFAKNGLKVWIIKTLLFVNLDKLGQKLTKFGTKLGIDE